MITGPVQQGDDVAVESRIHRIFRDDLELQVDVDTDVIADGILDSLSFVRLLVSLEEEFGLKMNLAELDLEDFSTVSSIARLVQCERAPGHTTRPIGSRLGARLVAVTVEPYLAQDPGHPDPQIPWASADSNDPITDQEEGVAAAMPVDRDLILVVEDDEDTRDVYREILETNGFEVRTTASGSDGLRLARGLRPRVILMDISLPEMDGWAVTAHLKEDPETRGIPVIIVTAYAFPEDRTRADRLGCEGFLSKPCEPSRMLAEVHRLLGTDGSS